MRFIRINDTTMVLSEMEMATGVRLEERQQTYRSKIITFHGKFVKKREICLNKIKRWHFFLWYRCDIEAIDVNPSFVRYLRFRSILLWNHLYSVITRSAGIIRASTLTCSTFLFFSCPTDREFCTRISENNSCAREATVNSPRCH